MELKFKNTYSDIFSFSFYHLIRSPLNIIINLILFLVFTYTAFDIVSAIDNKIIVKIIVFIFFEIIILLFIYLYLFIISILSMISRKNKPFLAERKMVFNDSQISAESEYGKSEYKWNIIQKLKQNRKYIFIYVSQHSAYIIPKNIFESKNEVLSFLEYIKERI